MEVEESVDSDTAHYALSGRRSRQERWKEIAVRKCKE